LFGCEGAGKIGPTKKKNLVLGGKKRKNQGLWKKTPQLPGGGGEGGGMMTWGRGRATGGTAKRYRRLCRWAKQKISVIRENPGPAFKRNKKKGEGDYGVTKKRKKSKQARPLLLNRNGTCGGVPRTSDRTVQR